MLRVSVRSVPGGFMSLPVYCPAATSFSFGSVFGLVCGLSSAITCHAMADARTIPRLHTLRRTIAPPLAGCTTFTSVDHSGCPPPSPQDSAPTVPSQELTIGYRLSLPESERCDQGQSPA